VNLGEEVYKAVEDAFKSTGLVELEEKLLRNLYKIICKFKYCPFCAAELHFEEREEGLPILCCPSDDCKFKIGDKRFYKRFVGSEEDES
jgi:hypothetical protein